MSTARVPVEATRRQLNARQAETVSRLIAAAREELRETGFADMTVRTVAGRAAVAPATAYTYFSSKDHLVAEIFWRQLANRPRPVSRKTSAYGRVNDTLADLADMIAEDPQLSAAVTVALLSEDPDVRHLRTLVGVEINDRIAAALGKQSSPAVLDALNLTWSGGMLQVGLGHAAAEDLGARLASAAKLIMRP
jgi:AcrR family transcriptional regulator